MWVLAAVMSAHAGPDCAIALGDEVAPGIPALHASCHWPDVQPDALQRVLGQLGHHHEFVWTIATETVVEQAEGVAEIHQRHEVPMVRPREATVTMRRHALPGGGSAVSWDLSPHQQATGDGAVAVLANRGRWVVLPAPDGGSQLYLDLAYAPGGSVPAWVVRWAQSSATTRVLRDLREASHGAELSAAL